jgi:hypothetical protein
MAVMPTDPNSPTYACDMAAYLRERYYGLLSGTGEKVVRYRGPNGEREVQFHSSNLAAMQAELQKWEGLCAGTTGENTSRRFAIRAGSMRTWSGS